MRKLIRLRSRLKEICELVFSYEVIRRVRHWRTIRKYGPLQKFWMGGKPELSASPLEVAYFEKLGMPSRILNCMDDYRSVGQLSAGDTVLPIEGLGPGEDVQFAVTVRDPWPEEAEISLELGRERRLIHSLRRNRWHDLRVRSSNSSGDPESLRISIPVPLFVTMPRAVKRARRNPSHASPQHVLICVLDSWSPRFLSEPHPFKEDTPVTPNIRRFFKEGFQALGGVSSAEWTLPIVSSIFTGMYPSRHKVSHPKRWVELDRKRRTLPEYFQQNGYHTLFGSSAPRLSPAFGLVRGFDRFLFHFPLYSSENYTPARWMNEILGHLEAHSYSKTFSYFHFPDTHPIWDTPDETRYFNLGRTGSTSFNLIKMLRGKSSRYDLPSQARNLYLLRMAEIDRILGTLFDYVQREFGDEALVVLTSDHGLKMPYISEEYVPDEPFLTDIRVQIPLFIRGAGIRPQVYVGQCQPNIDIPKILLDLAGIHPDDSEFDGINLLKPHELRQAVLSESFYGNLYEIAVRGFGHVLFLKFLADDVACRIIDPNPHYHALFRDGAASYAREHDLKETEPEIHARLHLIALQHITQLSLVQDSGKIGLIALTPQ